MQKEWSKDPALDVVIEKIGVDYNVLGYLGGGGLSRIYAIQEKFFGEENADIRALKIMDVAYLSQIFEKAGVKDVRKKFDNITERFKMEAQIFKKISHPNIAKLHKIGIVKDERRGIEIPYLVMEYINGKTLRDLIKEKSPLGMQTIFRLTGDILSALAAIHKEGVIHRDIKPGNIMIDKDGRAILIDFGLAKDKSLDGMLTTSSIIGTPAYIAPEILLKNKDAGPESDIYSFAIVLYEMAAGEKPFGGSSQVGLILEHLNTTIPDVTKKNPDLPTGLQKIIKKAAAKNPKDRYRSVTDFSNALKNLKEHLNDKSKLRFFRKWKLLALFFIILAAAFIVFNPLGIWKGVKEAVFSDDIRMVYIPSGEFISSGGKLNLPGYWMGKHEVSIKQYMKFVKESGLHQPEWEEDKSGYEGLIEDDSLPIVGISWYDAKAYCDWLSKKTNKKFTLPSKAQWEKAARGDKDKRDYPWGDKEVSCKHANYSACKKNKTMKITSHSKGASPYGLLNMAGNVEEWCNDKYPRGGSYLSNKNFIKITSPPEYEYKATHRLFSVGFRLCLENPEKYEPQRK